MTISRLRYDGEDLSPRMPNERTEAFNVITQLTDFRHHRLWRAGTLVHEGGHPRGTLAITDLREEWRCHHLSPFDNVRFQIPFSYIREFAADIGRPDFDWIECRPGTKDTVVLGLAMALLPALEAPLETNVLFVEQVVLAMMAHLAETYAGAPIPARKNGVLAPWQERRATELLAAGLHTSLSIGEVAQACNLSPDHFIRAFRATLGMSPHRWLMEYRVARAKDLLNQDVPLAEVAATCGFASLDRMTRVFSEMAGIAPDLWRRQNRKA